jgi:2,4-dienoyl-CoA reductase-like NADH-dependent reductase (Old Yellow Enzyme family)
VWTPPQRIKHALPIARWPSAEEARAARWFQPIAIGKLTAKQRTWVPAMVPWRATDEGFVTDEVIDWYRRFAQGRPGVIVVEATGIRDIPSGPLLRVGHDRFLPGLRSLVDAVREASDGETLLFLQIIDFLSIRRRPEREKFFARFLAITDAHREKLSALTGRDHSRSDESELRSALAAIADPDLPRVLDERELESLTMGYRERITDLHLPHVRDLPRVLPDLFANAAARAFAAGFHGVELHFAHAYTMASFLSARNDRPDGYGGPRENRVRLPLEVIAKVRERIGDAVLGCRFLGDEVIEGGNRVDDAAWFGVALARAGLDFLSLSKGGKFEDAKQPKVGAAAYPYTGQSGYECMPTFISDERGPFGRNVHLARTVRDAVRAAGFQTPIVAAGGIHDFDQAEKILAEGDADIVAAARQSLADPDWFRKILLGRGDEVRRCNFTNYCEALDQQHKQVTCKLWDRIDVDAEGVARDPTGHRRLLAPKWK